MNAKQIMLVSGAGVLLLAGCVCNPVTTSTVGPRPVEALAPSGHLQVFSDTVTIPDGDQTWYYPHTGYTIRDQSGKVLKYVPNHVGTMDQSPSLVTVPVGNYNVVAESSSYGWVTVPVVIQRGRTTVVHLDREWEPPVSTSSQLVRLPDGEPVGWSISNQ